MSYNINRWEQLRCDKLQIPRTAIDNLISPELNKVVYELDAENSRIKGVLTVNQYPAQIIQVVAVDSIYLRGEGSGHCFYDQLIPILKQSTGEYEAVIYWVDDALITHLLVKDGNVTETAISVPLLLAIIDDYQQIKRDIDFLTDHYEIPARLADRLADLSNRIKGL